LGVVDGYLEKREERKKKERAPPKAAFYQYEKAKERSKLCRCFGYVHNGFQN
jgi:hypothetical protein